MKLEFAREFIKFVDGSKSVYHTVDNIEKFLKEKKYVMLPLDKKWDIELGKNYYVKRGDSAIIGIKIPKTIDEFFYKITLNHVDTPGFKIKPNPVSSAENSYIRFNTEVYGGPILNTWMDRPLSAAGRVMVKGEGILKPKTVLVDLEKPLMVIPNVAIHQNTEVNNGVKLSRQNDMLPVAALIEEGINKQDLLRELIEKKTGVYKEEILDLEFYLYEVTNGTIFGSRDEFISVGKIDNLASVYTGLKGFLEAEDILKGIGILGCFDSEECGSKSVQGADTNFLSTVLERISLSLGKTRDEFIQSLYGSFMISVDGAHGVHPAKGGKTDITNKPKLNGGIVIKHSSNKSYSTDAFSSAVVKSIAKRFNIKYQEFVNHSDEKGGSTLGPITLAQVNIDCVDLGIPMLAMHSVREMAGVEDIYSLKEFLKNFYLVV